MFTKLYSAVYITFDLKGLTLDKKLDDGPNGNDHPQMGAPLETDVALVDVCRY